jgi:phosphoglucosamine mutase
MTQLFGTDGIRGKAGEFPLDRGSVQAAGWSLARHLATRLGRQPRLITGRDTRESGRDIEAWFHAGAASAGAEIESTQVITTPGVAYLTRVFGFDAGCVISASHNPFDDNGIKVFDPSGKKIDEELERAIEADILSSKQPDLAQVEVRSARAVTLQDAYVEHLLRQAQGVDLAGKRIVIDCANGAASGLAPRLFESLGAEIAVINCDPDGRNINLNCGSLHLDRLVDRVSETGAAMGVAFDGDADRALFSDENGNVIDGDATLWIMSRYLRKHGRLRNSKVVATVMSNIGLELALNAEGIELLRANVGDKYVLDKLLETGSELGGEQSGHIIFPEIGLAGDGMMTAVLLLHAITEDDLPLSRAAEGFTRYPQTLINVPVKEKRPFESIPQVANGAAEIERELAGSGRLLLRYSGTENLARVMIEGRDQPTIESQARRLADVIAQALG